MTKLEIYILHSLFCILHSHRLVSLTGPLLQPIKVGRDSIFTNSTARPTSRGSFLVPGKYCCHYRLNRADPWGANYWSE